MVKGRWAGVKRAFKKPWLALPPGAAYLLADVGLSLYSAYKIYTRSKAASPVWRPVQWKHLYFPNPLGPAGGVDKSARHIKAWQALGAGFIEIGTITPKAQTKNTGAVLKRSLKQQALWNHMGFPNLGVQCALKHIKKHCGSASSKQGALPLKPGAVPLRPGALPLFANISKNKSTVLKRGVEDYLYCIDQLSPYVSAFVINISSPNTPGLRDLSRPDLLKNLLRAVHGALAKKPHFIPFLVKWSPDMPEKHFLQALDIAIECGAGGHILCNSTVLRQGEGGFPAHGGVSGRPLANKAKDLLVLTQRHLGSERVHQLLVSVGGILTPEDVLQRLAMGADLVQVYSALVFEGPGFFRQAGALAQKT